MTEPTAERRPDSTCYRFGHGLEVVLADDGEISVQLWTAHEEAVLVSVNNGPPAADRGATTLGAAQELCAFTDELTMIRFWLLGKANLGPYRTIPSQT